MVSVKRIFILSVASCFAWNAANAEALYSVSTPVLSGQTLFDQQLTESGLVTIKPAVANASGDAAVMDQCLWSIFVNLDAGTPAFSAGKMICVGPNQEVLESMPLGEIAPFGQCANAKCSSFDVMGNTMVKMTLSNPLEFSLQPRNERQ